ncbi:MAG: glycosyl hydrolase [Thermoproteota archaeon]
MREEFSKPGNDFRGAPFWSWNDELTNSELCRQVREMKRAGLGSFFMHSRIGLITPYLSDEWMERIKAVVRESRRVGMNAWLYDEDRWPSGFAGGIVPAKGPEYRMKMVECEEVSPTNLEGAWKREDVVGVFACTKDGDLVRDFERLTDQTQKVEEGKSILVFSKKVAENSEWYNGYSYIDTLNPKVVDAFIESTYEAYKREVGREFGRTILGIFTDEPNFSEWGERAFVPWTERLPESFKEMNGYDLIDRLPSLFYNVGDYMRVRRDFWNTVTELFLESYSRRIYGWCEANKMKYTGHYLCEDNLTIQTKFIGAAMPHYEYMHVPGIDHLGRNIENLITVKQVSSAAHQLGKERVLSETYGCSGWNLSFEDQKWIGDWEYVLGVNLLNQHLALYSLRGCRKRDYPPSINFQQPWWPYYRIVSDYFARLSYMLTRGKFHSEILVIHPIQSAWSVYSPRDTSRVDEINKSFVYISESLCKIHRDYDLGDEKIIERHGRVEGDKMVVGKMRYSLVIVPPSTTLQASTFKLLRRFAEGGGKIIFVDPVPELVDCQRSDELRKLIDSARRISCDKDQLRKTLGEVLSSDVEILDAFGEQIEPIYYQHRIMGKLHIYFLANTDQQRSYDATIILSQEGGIEEWDLLKGSVRRVPCRNEGGKTIFERSFQPAGSALFVLDTSKRAGRIEERREKKIKTFRLKGEWMASRKDPNALMLDYCQYMIEGGGWSDKVPVWKVQREAEKLGKDTAIALKYTFRAEFKRKRGRIFVVMETPERYKIKFNGKEIRYREAGWWIDKSFKKIDVTKLVVNGENILEISCTFRRPTIPGTLIFLKDGIELESVYIVGDFSVKKIGREFILTDENYRVRTGDLVHQGYPFYAGTMIYTQTVNLQKAAKTYIEFESLDAIVTRVSVNGRYAGVIPWRPYRLEISRYVKKGKNTIMVETVSSCRNLLGPHHHKEGELLSVGPGSFSDEVNWTDEYSFVKFGIGDARIVQAMIE